MEEKKDRRKNGRKTSYNHIKYMDRVGERCGRKKNIAERKPEAYRKKTRRTEG